MSEGEFEPHVVILYIGWELHGQHSNGQYKGEITAKGNHISHLTGATKEITLNRLKHLLTLIEAESDVHSHQGQDQRPGELSVQGTQNPSSGNPHLLGMRGTPSRNSGD